MIDKNIISIIICTHNRCDSLRDTLESVINQDVTDDFNHEIIVVDNNSIDNTLNIVNRYIFRYKDRIKYFFEPTQGLSYARNKGIQESRGEIIAFTDDDCIVDKRWLIEINNIVKYDNIKCMTGKVLPIWNSERPLWLSPKLHSVIPYIDEGNIKKKYDYVTGANMIFKREVFDKVGLFDILPAEDTFFAHKVKQRFDIWYYPSLKVFHKILKHRMTKEYFRNWYYKSGKSIAILKEKYSNNEKEIINIPRWMYKVFIKNLLSYFINIDNVSKRFYFELQMLRFIGFCNYKWFGR